VRKLIDLSFKSTILKIVKKKAKNTKNKQVRKKIMFDFIKDTQRYMNNVLFKKLRKDSHDST